MRRRSSEYARFEKGRSHYGVCGEADSVPGRAGSGDAAKHQASPVAVCVEHFREPRMADSWALLSIIIYHSSLNISNFNAMKQTEGHNSLNCDICSAELFMSYLGAEQIL